MLMNKKSLKLKEGWMNKGGLNDAPNCSRPSNPPCGQGTKRYEMTTIITSNYCIWKRDIFDLTYDTQCKNKHILIDGTLKDNKYEYCPYCGQKIEVSK